MAKFKKMKDEANEALLKQTREKVEGYLKNVLDGDPLTQVEDVYSFEFGTAIVTVRVAPWHAEDALVEVYSYVAEDVELTPELMENLLRLNAREPFGAFGVGYDNAVVYSYSLAAANLDENEFVAAVQTVATVAYAYDEKVADMETLRKIS
jgi:heat shock protein HspQ